MLRPRAPPRKTNTRSRPRPSRRAWLDGDVDTNRSPPPKEKAEEGGGDFMLARYFRKWRRTTSWAPRPGSRPPSRSEQAVSTTGWPSSRTCRRRRSPSTRSRRTSPRARRRSSSRRAELRKLLKLFQKSGKLSKDSEKSGPASRRRWHAPSASPTAIASGSERRDRRSRRGEAPAEREEDCEEEGVAVVPDSQVSLAARVPASPST